MELVNGNYIFFSIHKEPTLWCLPFSTLNLLPVYRQPPVYEVPEDINFYKTIIAGFPSGDKRMTYVQMEALSGWPAKDEWDFEHLGMSNHPFIKANYPHHG
jgi:hypothetical protein